MAELIPVVESTVGRLGAVTASRTALAFTYAQGGRLDDARVELSRLTASGLAGIRKDATWIPVLAMLSEVAADLGDAAMSESLYACLEPYRERANAVGHGLACYGALTRYLARLAETAGRTEEADDLYRDALARNDLMQAIPAGARTRLGYARFLRATGRSDEEVRALAEQALATATRIGMDGVARSAHELLAGLRPVADATVPSAPAAGREGTVTILFTDVEASTELTERIGDRRSQQVLGAHNRLVRAQMTAHRGEAVQSRGDGFMAAFQSAGRALECAVAIQEAVAAYSKAHPDTPLAVRIGLHTGEPLREGEDFYGRAVHLAARIAGQAAGGEILVSGLVRELVSASDDLRFGDAKSVELRGLAGVHTVHSVEWRR
jgi:class 3 adenylate cyclase